MGTGGAGFGKVSDMGVRDHVFRFGAGVLYCVSIELECVEESATCDDIAFFLYFYSYYSYSAPFRSMPLHSAPLPTPDSPISPIAVAHHTLWLRHA